MKFKFRRGFDASVEEVERVLFHEGLNDLLKKRMSTIIDIETIEVSRNGDQLHRRVRYLPQPLIRSIAGKKVEPEWMEWFEESTYNFSTHSGHFRNIPTHYRIAAVLKNEGTLTLRSLGPNRCEEVLQGDLTVSVFLLGKIAEKIIQTNAFKILEEQAKILDGILQSREL